MAKVDVAVVLLTLIATGTAAAIEGTEGEAPPISVPLAHIGDIVDYVTSIEGKRIAYDWDAFEHRPIQVQDRIGFELRVEAPAPGPHGEEAPRVVLTPRNATGVQPATHVWFDGAERQAAARSFDRQFSSVDQTHILGPLWRSPYVQGIAGIQDELSRTSTLSWNVEFLVQGRTLTPGMDLTQEALDRGMGDALVRAYTGPSVGGAVLYPRAHSFQMMVGEPELLDGVPAIPVIRNVTLRAELCDIHQCTRWNQIQTDTYWFGNESAWPVYIEKELRRTGHVPDGPEWLVGVDLDQEMVYRSKAITQERGSTGIASPSPAIPQSPSDRATLLYPLADAVANVLDDPALVAFQLWREAAPTVKLAGATFSFQESPGGVYSLSTDNRYALPAWELVFQGVIGADDEFYAVKTQGAQVPINQPYGVSDWPSTELRADVPDFNLDLSHVLRQHETLLGHGPERIDGLRWGFDPDIGPVPGEAIVRLRSHGDHGSLEMIEVTSDEQYPIDVRFEDKEQVQAYYNARTGQAHRINEATFSLRVDGPTSPPEPAAPQTEISTFDPPSRTALLVTTGATGGLLLAVYALARVLLPHVLVIRAAARVEPETVLDHPVRRAAHELVGQQRCSTSDVAQALDISLGRAIHHLRVLAKLGHVQRQRHGRTTYWNCATTQREPVVLHNEVTRRVYEALKAAPFRQVELAAAHSMSQAGIRHHLQRLESAGLVESKRVGRGVLWSATQAA